MNKQFAEVASVPAGGRTLSRRRFLRLGGASIAAAALLGTAGPVLGETTTSAHDLGIRPSNAPSENRKKIIEALSGSSRSVKFPAGDYLIDNSGSYIVIMNFSGILTMESGARFVFTDNTTRGLMFGGGTGARFYGLRTTFKVAPAERIIPQDVILFDRSVETTVRDARIDGSASCGLLFWQCVRPSIYGAEINNTMADGVHFANCQDARADNVRTENTGDDGLAFVSYGGGPDNTGGLATNITVMNSGTRGITVLGQRDVTIDGFKVDTTYSSGVLVAEDPAYNTRVPSGVQYINGVIANAGKGSRGNGTGSGNKFGVEYWNAESATFRDIKVISPATRGVSGSASNGKIRLIGVQAHDAMEQGFSLSADDLYMEGLLAKGARGVGIGIVSSRRVTYRTLRSVSTSRSNDTYRAFNIENNGYVDGDQLEVVDKQAKPTGYTVSTYGRQEGSLGTILHTIPNGKLRVTNSSGLKITRTAKLV